MFVLHKSIKSALIAMFIVLSISMPVLSVATQLNAVLEKEKHFPVTGQLPLKDIIIAVKLGLLNRHWEFKDESETAIVATFIKKKYLVKTRFIVSQNDITVQYMESRNLRYGTDSGDDSEFARKYPEGTFFIHPSYNRWLTALFRDIEVEIKRIMVKKGLL